VIVKLEVNMSATLGCLPMKKVVPYAIAAGLLGFWESHQLEEKLLRDEMG
jgi:hypothetical protein